MEHPHLAEKGKGKNIKTFKCMGNMSCCPWVLIAGFLIISFIGNRNVTYFSMARILYHLYFFDSSFAHCCDYDV